MWILFNIYIILTTIAFYPKCFEPFNLPKHTIFTIFGFIMFGFSFMSNTEKKKTLNNIWLGLIFIYIMLHFGWFFYKGLFVNSGEPIKWCLWNYLPTINFILGILLIQTLVERTDRLSRWITISKVLCWLGFGLAIYSILQFLGLDQIFHKNLYWLNANVSESYKGNAFQNYRMITFFGNKMQTATYLAIISPLYLMFKSYKFLAMYIIVSLAILMTMSLLGILGLVIGLIVFLLLTKEIKLASLIFGFSILAIITLSIFKPSFFDLYGRLSLYKQVFLDGCGKAFTGSGLGSFSLTKYLVNNSIVANLGFELLQLFREGGLILVTLVSIYIFMLLVRSFLIKDSMLSNGYLSMFIVFLIISAGGYTLRYAPFSLLGIICIANLEYQT